MSALKSLSLMAAVSVLFLTGCSISPTVSPYEGEQEGLVVFGTDIVVKGDAELEYNYIFSVENVATGEVDRMRMVVREGETYAVLGRLPNGEYRFVKREDIRRDARGIRLEEIDGHFTVAAGEVTLPKMIRVEKGLYTRVVEITELTNADGRVLFDLQLANQSSLQGWRYHPRAN
ncbi:hypothetical protein BGP77_15275 [Saccharospirillum sp. MSK14-1]|uniref:hypothetical protein n=1 Tax=Saccharospirillum sp. MSK14-1 TaxID=1897632 RepID=UPI000D384B86|nr:hypothetical protein [Saccharospirillum sp. MSK14-1]PTY37833.1 hypothetical protein BGP77_15275 [Saccharospirillum sp. MSK14-1]